MSSYIYGVNNYSLYALPTAWFCAGQFIFIYLFILVLFFVYFFSYVSLLFDLLWKSVLPHWYGIYKYKTLNRGEWDNACPPAFVAALQKREKLSAE